MTTPDSKQPHRLRAISCCAGSGLPRLCALLLVTAVGVVLLLALGVASSTADKGGHHRPVAVAASELNFVETGHLHLVSHHNELIVEEGHGTGTLSGNITVRMTLAYSQATVSFTAYPSSGGTVSGRGEGSIYAEGHNADFTGNAAITGGTGKYAHASGRNIRIKGTLQRKTFALYVEVEGKMRY
jgi:hypothetical protein